jgi:hypothetical protein
MTQIIKFTDVNVDGCGTDIEVYVQVEGKAELTNGIIKRTKEVIEEYKKENEYEYDTASIIDVACKHLETEGYMCFSVIPDYDIEF